MSRQEKIIYWRLLGALISNFVYIAGEIAAFALGWPNVAAAFIGAVTVTSVWAFWTATKLPDARQPHPVETIRLGNETLHVPVSPGLVELVKSCTCDPYDDIGPYGHDEGCPAYYVSQADYNAARQHLRRDDEGMGTERRWFNT